MYKGQKSVRNGIEDFLCPFTDFYLTCGSNEGKYHKGTMAIDVRGAEPGVRYPYYAPATSKCIRTYPESGQVMWQTTDTVRCSNGYIGYVTYMTVHDDTMDAYPGMIRQQGEQLGNMGTKGNATGVHCHIEFSQSNDTTWYKNSYGNYMFNCEVDPENVMFMDDTNIIFGYGAWKYLSDVPIIEVTPNVERDEYKDQIEVKVPELRVRTSPSLSADIIGYASIGFYDYYETIQSDSYEWYRISDNQWIAYDENWENVYPAKPKTITLDILDEKDGYVLVDLGQVYIKFDK